MGKTKAEECEALRKIRKILEDFSPDETYIGKAFDGCVEQAEENIRNDWMMSWRVRFLDEQLKNCRRSDKVEALTKTLNQKDDAIARLEDAKNQLSVEINRLIRTLDHKNAACTDLEGRLEKFQRQISDLRQTILELKAKLYDMMTREEVSG